MTNEEAIEILIAVAVCDRPILSCDFCARYKGTGNGCDEPTDKEVEEAVLLLKGASNDAAISAIRQQEHFRDLTKKVETLTNAQKIRSMSDEELAECLFQIGYDNGWSRKEYAIEWLQRPSGEEDKHETV